MLKSSLLLLAPPAVLLAPAEALANPVAWAAARFVGQTIAGWAIGKGLDAAWKLCFEVDNDGDETRVAQVPQTCVDLSDRVYAGASGEQRLAMDNGVYGALDEYDEPLTDFFEHLGRPTSRLTERTITNRESDAPGTLTGQWWTPHPGTPAGTDRRYVVTRTYEVNGRSHYHYLPFRDRGTRRRGLDAARIAAEVVAGAPPSRGRMNTLFYEPWAFQHEQEDRPGRGS